MSNMSWPCPEGYSDNSPCVQHIKVQLAKINKEIKDLECKISCPDGLGDQIKENAECCEEAHKRIDGVNSQIDEINKNVTISVGWNKRQDKKIDWLKTKVIRDNIYLNFEDWYKNVYLPNDGTGPGSFNVGDIYINVNTNPAATNTSYINTRPDTPNKPTGGGDPTNPNDPAHPDHPDNPNNPNNPLYPFDPNDPTDPNHPTNPNSPNNPNNPNSPYRPVGPNDWQEIYHSSPADIITILGIDPIEVHHPFKHEWVVSINPKKLADMLGELKEIDLSKVKVKLGDISNAPVFKNNVNVKLNLTVEGDTILNNLQVKGDTVVERIAAEELCAKLVTCDMQMDQSLNVNENITVGKSVTTPFLHVTSEAKLDKVELNGPVYIQPGCANPGDAKADLSQMLYTASFAKLTIEGASKPSTTRSPDQDQDRTRVIALGSPQLVTGTLNGQQVKDSIGILKLAKYSTPDISIDSVSGAVMINNSGSYLISYTFGIAQSQNIMANRAGVCMIVSGESFQMCDSKFGGASAIGQEGTIKKWYDTNKDHCSYDGSNINERTEWGANFGALFGQWYAAGTTLMHIPCGGRGALFAYMKPSASGGFQPEGNNAATVKITDGEWTTGGLCTITIAKIGNATHTPQIV